MNVTCSNATLATAEFEPLVISITIRRCGWLNPEVAAAGRQAIVEVARQGKANRRYLSKRVDGEIVDYLRDFDGSVPVRVTNYGARQGAGRGRQREAEGKADEQRQAARCWTNWAAYGLPDLDALR